MLDTCIDRVTHTFFLTCAIRLLALFSYSVTFVPHHWHCRSLVLLLSLGLTRKSAALRVTGTQGDVHPLLPPFQLNEIWMEMVEAPFDASKDATNGCASH